MHAIHHARLEAEAGSGAGAGFVKMGGVGGSWYPILWHPPFSVATCVFVFSSPFSSSFFWKVGKLESSLGRRRPSSHGQSKNGAKLVSSTPKEKGMSVR